MAETYIKLTHANEENNNWFVVNWCLGNACNYKCSYCPETLHDASIKWPEIETIKNFILKVKNHHSNKKLYFEFTGGEVTFYKDFIELCKFCHEHGVMVGIITNGSMKREYWHENKKYFNHICMSFHYEFTQADHFMEIIREVHNDVRTHVNIMMIPEKFDECYEIASKIKDLGNISMALQPLIINLGDTLFPYNRFQKNILDKQFNLIVKHIKFDRHFDYYRGAMKKILHDGREIVEPAQNFVSSRRNDWSGWYCSAGVEQLVVDMDHSVHRGWCNEGGSLGLIDDPKLVLPSQPILCTQKMCHCNFDIMSTKRLTFAE